MRLSSRGRVLELERGPLRALHNQEAQLGVAVRCPEEAFAGVGPVHPDDLLQREPLPRRAELGMSAQAVLVRQVEQRVKNAAVAEQSLGRLDLSLAQVLVPGLQRAGDERAVEDVEVALDCRGRDVERGGRRNRWILALAGAKRLTPDGFFALACAVSRSGHRLRCGGAARNRLAAAGRLAVPWIQHVSCNPGRTVQPRPPKSTSRDIIDP